MVFGALINRKLLFLLPSELNDINTKNTVILYFFANDIPLPAEFFSSSSKFKYYSEWNQLNDKVSAWDLEYIHDGR